MTESKRKPAARKAARPRKKAKPAAAHPQAAPPPSVPSLEVSEVERPSDADVAARIRELENKMDEMMVEHARERESQHDVDDGPRRRLSTVPPARPSAPAMPEGMLDTARELLSTEF